MPQTSVPTTAVLDAWLAGAESAYGQTNPAGPFTSAAPPPRLHSPTRATPSTASVPARAGRTAAGAADRLRRL